MLQVSAPTRTFFGEIFGIFRAFYLQSNCERPSLSFLILFLETLQSFSFLVWSQFACPLAKTNIWKQDWKIIKFHDSNFLKFCEIFQNFLKFLSWMLGFLFKLIFLTAVLLQVTVLRQLIQQNKFREC